MILPGQTIRQLCEDKQLLDPWCERTEQRMWIGDGWISLTGGLSPAGYDIHLGMIVMLTRHTDFILASSLERFKMPNDVMGQVCDKSTWARRGLFVQNTIIEPGWEGYLTLELTYQGLEPLHLNNGVPIAQIIFMRLEEATENPYEGKYQNQKLGPQEAI